MSKRSKDPAYTREKRRGITDEQFSEMIAYQGNRCAICLDEFTAKKRPCVDHDNETRKVRGILCPGCNTRLGVLKDNPEALRAKGYSESAWYVERAMARKGY